MKFTAASLGALALASPAFSQTAPAATPVPAPTSTPAVAQPAFGDLTNEWVLDLSTGGRVLIMLRPDMAPNMVERVKTLTRQHFYDGLAFHRVIEGFMAQGGDPKGDGTGGSTLPNVAAEFNALPHVRGAVAAARAEDKNSANSQFYIIFQPTLKLDRKYTVFGRVIDGMAYVDAIQRGEPPAAPSRIVHAYIASDSPPAYTPAPVAAPTLKPSVATISATPVAVRPANAKARR